MPRSAIVERRIMQASGVAAAKAAEGVEQGTVEVAKKRMETVVVNAAESVEKSAKSIAEGIQTNLKGVKLLKNAYLAKQGIDAHILKQEWLHDKAILKHSDIYRQNERINCFLERWTRNTDSGRKIY